MRKTLRWMVLAGAQISACLAQDPALSAKFDHVVESYQKNRGFMGTVLAAKSGKVIFEKGYGMADLEWDVPNTPTTKFRLGSITKQFTAAAILQLQERHKLSVSDKACTYFEGCPESWKQITVQQLLTHTSGIPSYTADKEFVKPKFMRVPLTPAEIVLLSKDKPLDFDPGTKFSYDNTGYIFLGAIIEKVSGEKYADYLEKHIFEPLGMRDSGYDDPRTILKNRASGYRPHGAGFENDEYLDMSLPYAAGSLYSTVRDLYVWDRALYGDKVLSKASRDEMFTPVKNNYGYGMMVAPMFDHKQVGHGGGINGFSSMISRFPDDDAVVIVLSNNAAGNASGVANALAATLFGVKTILPGERVEVSVDPKTLRGYAGIYQVGPLRIAVTVEDDHVMIQPQGQGKVPAFASSEKEFFLKVADVVLTFTTGPDGKATEVQLKEASGTMSGKRVE